MNDFPSACSALYLAFIDQLKRVEYKRPESREYISTAMAICITHIEQLRDLVKEFRFPDIEQEIRFFKEIKPLFTSQVIYYLELFNLHNRWPAGDTAVQKQHLDEACKKIYLFYHEYQSFYEYHRSGLTHMDNQYFVRGRPDWRLYADSNFLATDPIFCSPCDHKLATLLAYERLQEYIQERQRLLLTSTENDGSGTSFLKWTGPLNGLVELLYAFDTTGAINNGKITLAEIARLFESFFNIPLRDFYKTYAELKMRKISRTKYLDHLRDELNRRMEEDDE